MPQLYDLGRLDFTRRRYVLQYLFESDDLYAIPLWEHAQIPVEILDSNNAALLQPEGNDQP